ncbi:FAD/NAD(P)-binding oxidoreductase isoform 1 [Hibiscus syriacus]|uniref:FAD/NAD(P)-binding oxidoreductase isoform 1 n=1 Tax=Hibiscus syriacus TaxID=106335 RepID=A0A6A2ZM36_HIBSY|nr:CAX-interacting protein 4-like [Hibiscus syriacus]KAE8692359.1 FAD/NAD(P)-binding oxidoreductase isoform 1 [Hibiscus syriacus]
MDCKKFIQLVEEKKRALEKKEAPLKWEQKLEVATKARLGAEAKEKRSKRVKHKRYESNTDTESDSTDGGIKRRRRSHKKHRKNAHGDSGENERRNEKKSKKKSKSLSSGSSHDFSNEYESSYEEERRKKRSCRKWKHHNSRSYSESIVSDDTDKIKRKATEDTAKDIIGEGLVLQDLQAMKLLNSADAPRRQSHVNHSKHHQGPNSVVSGSLDCNDERPRQRGRL